MTIDANAARSFGPAADLYDAIRPTYPAEALRWQTGDTPQDIVDLGAGTGLLTRGLIAQGHRVTAVEPDDQMRAKLTASSPGLAAAHAGAAEALPLPDASADIVTAGQAFHWFDRERALPEIRRVLRPGGLLAPIWNVRDDRTGWVGALTVAIGSSQGERDALAATEPGYFGHGFGEPEYRVFRHDMPLDRAGLRRLVQSRSYYLTADDNGQERILAVVDEVADTHPDLRGRETFAMPYQTYAIKVRPA
ncbi:class I SAM-dependent methyltransferase [Glycomyces algeriensis]|uniref:Methyltransferase n=1 Tax=Glycomyces algeriensis TaxID=256037 RepID=A0A9W6G9H4_9ACTN|nr:class I SAM-dependent methyltransferase [Glycomyces algeriensis]MDA1367286.1 class I SAM-dependent methyltransferase [Glycomyces algeriensis]MDR7351062.1 SAM-dependent methyltransferase [Glycomyces algeriensis]GLI43775.1 putative methyltransferase [Glycomyces algeriensis]